MAKQKHKRENALLYARICHIAARPDAAPGRLAAPGGLAAPDRPAAAELRKMKKFRFQLLHQWLTTHVAPCRVADVGGGKGLLSYLLQESGWQATVIDPIDQPLPVKYKDLQTKKQVQIAATARVPRLSRRFEPGMAEHFDLLLALHAHGCNIQLIDSARAYRRDLILLPCCVIGEPTLPPPGIEWIQWVVEYVIDQGFIVQPFRLNFKGQNIGIYARMEADEDGKGVLV